MFTGYWFKCCSYDQFIFLERPINNTKILEIIGSQLAKRTGHDWYLMCNEDVFGRVTAEGLVAGR